MKINRTHNAIRNMLWGYISKVCNIFLPFIVRTIIIQKLGAEYLGLNSLFTSILQVLSLSELGFGTAMVYSMYEPIASNNYEKLSALLNLYKYVYQYIGMLILGIGTILVPFIPKLISGSYPKDINIYAVYYLFLINTVISYFVFAYRTSILSAYQREDLLNKVSTGIGLIKNILQAICILMTSNFYLYVVVIIATTILSNVINYCISRKYFPWVECCGKVDLAEKQSIKKNVLALMCHKIGGTVLNSADSIVISGFLGLSVLAQYNNYYYIISSLESIVIICFTGLTAGIGNSFILDSVEKNQRNFFRILFFNEILVLGFSSVLFSVYQNFIVIWIGEEYCLPVLMVYLLIIYFFVHSIRRTAIVFRDAKGMWWDNKWQPLVSAIINLIINIVLVKLIGLTGVVISSIFSMIIVDIPWESHCLCRNALEISEWKYYIKLLKYLLTICLALLIDYILEQTVHEATISTLFMRIIIGIIGAFVAYVIFLARDIENKYFFKLIGGILNNHKIVDKDW